MEYKVPHYNPSCIPVIYHQTPFIVDNYGLWLLAYKQTHPEAETVKIISRKIYYKSDTDLSSIFNCDILQKLDEIIKLANGDNSAHTITFSVKTLHLDVFETAVKLLDLQFNMVPTSHIKTYTLNFLQDEAKKILVPNGEELKIMDINYFKLSPLERKQAYAFRYPLENNIVVYLIHTVTVFEDSIYFGVYKDGVKEPFKENIKVSLEQTFNPRMVYYLTYIPQYEILFLNEVFGSNVSVYYPSQYHYEQRQLRYFETRVKMTPLPDLEFLSIIKDEPNGRLLWYRTPLSDYIVYFSLTYGKKVYLHYVGFKLKNRNKGKYNLVEKHLSSYIDILFLNRFKNENYLCNEAGLLSYLNCDITRYTSKNLTQ